MGSARPINRWLVSGVVNSTQNIERGPPEPSPRQWAIKSAIGVAITIPSSVELLMPRVQPPIRLNHPKTGLTIRWVYAREMSELIRTDRVIVNRPPKKGMPVILTLKELPKDSESPASACMPTASECRRFAELRADGRTVPEELKAKIEACQPSFHGVYMDLRELAAA